MTSSNILEFCIDQLGRYLFQRNDAAKEKVWESESFPRMGNVSKVFTENCNLPKLMDDDAIISRRMELYVGQEEMGVDLGCYQCDQMAIPIMC